MGTTLERRSDFFPRFAEWFEMPELFRFFDRDRFGEMIRVEETAFQDHLLIKAEMPGIDPDKDVEISIADGMLTIAAERREEHQEEKEGRSFSEFRYGSFRRSLRVPKDVKVEDVTATYQDGILTVKVPIPEKPTKPEAFKVPVSRN